MTSFDGVADSVLVANRASIPEYAVDLCLVHPFFCEREWIKYALEETIDRCFTLLSQLIHPAFNTSQKDTCASQPASYEVVFEARAR